MEACLLKLPVTSELNIDASTRPDDEQTARHAVQATQQGGIGVRPMAERLVIEQTVAQVFGVEGGDLRRSTRGRAKVARARQVAMYLAHVACGMSLSEVGRTFARDRTTVSHACGVVEDGRDDPTFDRVLELLEQVVQALLGARGSRLGERGNWLYQ